MSEIRKIVAKVLKESNFSLNEKLEVQPDMFGGEDTYYKDGKKAIEFDDVHEFMKTVAPDLDYVDDRPTKDLYWMIYEPATPGLSKLDSKRVVDLESKLAEKFGDGVVKVKLNNARYAPEIRYISIGFVDKADIEDEGMEEATKLLKKGQRVRIKDTAEHFQGEEGVILVRMHSALTGTPFYTVQMDNGQSYDVLADNVEPADLEEGWKDNLKKGVATLGVAGALAGNVMAHDPMYDGAQRPFDNPYMTVEKAQWLADEDEKAVRLPNGMIKDQYGNEWTQEDWETLMRGEDPSDELDFPPEYTDQIED